MNDPKERPIIFSGPMVRAILDGRKTMTRRLANSPLRMCQPGDGLWVREAWKTSHTLDKDSPAKIGAKSLEAGYARPWMPIYYVATETAVNWDRHTAGRLRPGMHMPRWASRITLRVTGIKVERLQDISKDDVIAEGIEWRNGFPITDCVAGWHEPFAALWNKLHGTGAWEANPEVAVISFSRPASDRVSA